jgi:hypothetical protein
MTGLVRTALAAAIGLGITGTGLGLGFIDTGPWIAGVGRVMLWPVIAFLYAFPAPCFDRGPGQAPFCEGTPIQLLAILAGIVVSVLFYAGAAYVGLAPRARRMQTRARST